MNRLQKLFLGIWLIFVWIDGVKAEILVRDRHIILIQSGVDGVWGSYLFMVSNPSDKPIYQEMSLMLPKETVDWQAQESLAPHEIQLAKDGGLRLAKEFTPGDHLLSIGFKVPASGGRSEFTLTPPFPIGSLGIFVSEPALKLQGDAFTVQENVPFSGRTYNTYTIANAETGKNYRAVITGVPEGRGRFWIIGAVFGGLMLIGGGLAAWKTKPQVLEGEVVS